MKRIIPSVFKIKAYKDLLNMPPELIIEPIDKDNKDDRKKAKLMTKLMNYMFETNANGATDKYWAYIRRESNKYIKEQFQHIKATVNLVDIKVKKK